MRAGKGCAIRFWGPELGISTPVARLMGVEDIVKIEGNTLAETLDMTEKLAFAHIIMNI